MLDNDLIGGITITRENIGISRTNFATILILGNTKTNTEDIKEYSRLSELISDGYSLNTPEYKAFLAMSAQQPTISKIIIAQKKTDEDWGELFVRYKNSNKYAYCVILANTVTQQDPQISDFELEELATAIDVNLQVFAVNITADKINVAEALKTAGLKRCLTIYKDANNEFPNAAIMARILALDPGSRTLSTLKVSNVVPANLSMTKQSEYNNVYLNYYDYITNSEARIGPSCGKTTNGIFFEDIFAEDWMTTYVKENLVRLYLLDKKISFNLEGFAMISGAIHQALSDAVRKKVIEPLSEDSITMPNLSEISPADRAAGILKGITFKFQLTGSIKKIEQIIGYEL